MKKLPATLLFIPELLTFPLSAEINSANQRPDQPNFVLMVADDLGFADLSMNGSKQIPTPNFDHF